MATSTSRKNRPGRALTVLLLLAAVLFGAIGASALWSDGSWKPKLALDLEGGTQIILTPSTTDGSKVTDTTITQAINVIRQRVDSSGVSEAQITSQGGSNIVVALPGSPSQDTIDLVSKSAQMRFRPVLVIGAPTVTPEPTATPTPGATAGSTATPRATETPTPTPTATTKNSSYEEPSAATDAANAAYVPAADPSDPATAGSGSTTEPDGQATEAPTPAATSGTGAATTDDGASSLSQITPAIEKKYDALDCTDEANRKGGGGDDPDAVLVTCQADGSAKYILGPVEIEGTEIKSASSGLETTQQGVTTNNWVVSMDFTSRGADQFAATTKRLASLESPRNQFGMVLDGLVIESASVGTQFAQTGITGGKAQISGSFTRDSAATLANQLNFGALPLTFTVQSQEQISATLGSEQLQKGLLAGLIGLALVVVYSMFQYRVLGLLTIGSLLVAGILVYGVITFLSWSWGYRLSLPGVAGLIVAIGFTADSFIVYFERIRDELRDGRTLEGAVEKGWARARRTILASDTVNLLLAVVLYFLAVGGVQGFAVALFITTLVDLVVIFLFTHPVMSLLSRRPFFRDGHAASGLSPKVLGAYAGRGRVRSPSERVVAGATPAGGVTDVAEPATTVVAGAPASGDGGSDGAEVREEVGVGARGAAPATAPDGRRLTIAERRAAERRAARDAAGPGASATGDENEENR